MAGHETKGVKNQPVNKVVWVECDKLRANNYNPNQVFTPERKLLRLSILEDGWTQPIVAMPDNEIVDGFHRWRLACTDPAIQAMTGGKVPVVYLRESVTYSHQVMSTIRHNRARGVHMVLDMASVVQLLKDKHDLSVQEIMDRLGMDAEEVARLCDRGGMIERGSSDEFGPAWVPTAEEK